MLIGIGRRPQSADLVDLLLECHERIRSFSRLTVALGQRSDVAVAEVVDACLRSERYFGEGLRLHVEDEEQSVLPRLLGCRPEVDEALDLMRRQHGGHENQLVALVEALGRLRADPEAAERRAALHVVADGLAREFEEHLDLEENVIFPAIRALVPLEAQLLCIDELRARRHQRTKGPIQE